MKCSNCGSGHTESYFDTFGCLDCGAQTAIGTGETVRGPKTAHELGGISGNPSSPPPAEPVDDQGLNAEGVHVGPPSDASTVEYLHADAPGTQDRPPVPADAPRVDYTPTPGDDVPPPPTPEQVPGPPTVDVVTDDEVEKAPTKASPRGVTTTKKAAADVE